MRGAGDISVCFITTLCSKNEPYIVLVCAAHRIISPFVCVCVCSSDTLSACRSRAAATSPLELHFSGVKPFRGKLTRAMAPEPTTATELKAKKSKTGEG